MLYLKIDQVGVPVVAQWLTNPTGNQVAGSIPALAQWVKDPVLPRAVVWVAAWAGSLALPWCGVGQQLQPRFDP